MAEREQPPAGASPRARAADGAWAPLRGRRSLAARIVALVVLVLVSNTVVAVAIVGEMRGLRARFDLLTSVYVPFQERLGGAHVQSAKIAAAVAESEGPLEMRSGDLLNLSEALERRAELVAKAKAPLEQAIAHPERIGGGEQLPELEHLLALVLRLEELVEIDQSLDPIDVAADARRQDEIGKAFRALEEAARRTIRIQRDAVRGAAREAERFTWLVSLGLGIAALMATLLVIFTLRPLRRLPVAVRRLAGGDWSQRIEGLGPPERDDEVARLSRSFNDMAAALEERERRLIAQERLAAVGQMAAQVTHEIRNPLSSVALSAELLEDELPAEAAEAQRLLARITGEVDRLTQITETYLGLSRRESPALLPLDLSALCSELLDFLAQAHARAGLSVHRELEPGVKVRGDPVQLRQAVMNLLRNAAEAAVSEAGRAGAESAGRSPEIRVELRASAGSCAVVVRDSGPGIDLPEHERARIFEPFFTDKAQGTGLGLPMVQQIAAEHGGSVRVLESGPEGSAFELRLPACDP